MKDGNQVIARVSDSHLPSPPWNQRSVASFSDLEGLSAYGHYEPGSICSQIKTMSRTDVDPCTQIMAYELDHSHALGAHIFLEKA